MTDADILLRYIIANADLLDVETLGERRERVHWLLMPVSSEALAELATFGAHCDDDEANGDDEGEDREANVVATTMWQRDIGSESATALDFLAAD